MAHAQHSSFRPMAEVPFRPVRQLSEYKGKGASASREIKFGLTEIVPEICNLRVINLPLHWVLLKRVTQ